MMNLSDKQPGIDAAYPLEPGREAVDGESRNSPTASHRDNLPRYDLSDERR